MTMARHIPPILNNEKANDMNDTFSKRDIIKYASTAVGFMIVAIIGLCSYILNDTKAGIDKSISRVELSIHHETDRMNNKLDRMYEILIKMSKK